jgi:hypothetical protein
LEPDLDIMCDVLELRFGVCLHGGLVLVCKFDLPRHGGVRPPNEVTTMFGGRDGEGDVFVL